MCQSYHAIHRSVIVEIRAVLYGIAKVINIPPRDIEWYSRDDYDRSASLDHHIQRAVDSAALGRPFTRETLTAAITNVAIDPFVVASLGMVDQPSVAHVCGTELRAQTISQICTSVSNAHHHMSVLTAAKYICDDRLPETVFASAVRYCRVAATAMIEVLSTHDCRDCDPLIEQMRHLLAMHRISPDGKISARPPSAATINDLPSR